MRLFVFFFRLVDLVRDDDLGGGGGELILPLFWGILIMNGLGWNSVQSVGSGVLVTTGEVAALNFLGQSAKIGRLTFSALK